MKTVYSLAVIFIFGALGVLALLGPGIGVMLIILTGLAVGLVGVGYLQTYYTVWRSDPADLRVVADAGDAIEVTGTAKPHTDTLHAPFTGTECVLYAMKVVELGMTPAERRRVRERQADVDADVYMHTGQENNTTLLTDEQAEPFVVSTDTGETLIQPEGAQWEIESTDEINVEAGVEPPRNVATVLDTHPQLEVVSDEKRLFLENRIGVGDDVHIYGPVRRAGSSFDLPGGVKAVIGLENPGSDSFVLGEDGVSDLLDQINTANRARFTISTGGEIEAERRFLKTGLLWGSVGAVFVGVGIFLAV
jgi:hypothetical protein